MENHPVFHNSLCLHTKKPLPMVPTTFVLLLKLLVKKMTIMKLRQSCISTNQEPSRNQYLVKWKGYPDSDNSWEPASHMKNAVNLVTASTNDTPTFHSLQTLQEQYVLKRDAVMKSSRL